MVSCAGSATQTAAPVVNSVTKTPANQPFWASSKSIKSRCDSDVGEAKRLENATIAASGTTGALDAYNDLLILSQDLSNQLALILQAHPNSSVREAAADCSQRLQGLLDRLTEDRVLYDALDSVDQKLIPLQAQNFLSKELRSFRLKGVALDADQRQRVKVIQEQLRNTRKAFLKNIQDDVRYISVRPAQLDGLPDRFKDQHPPQENGLISVSTQYSDYIPILTYARDELIRETLTKEFHSRGYAKNQDTLIQLLKLRHEYAELLGFSSWADYVAQDKMVDSSSEASDFTSRIAQFVKPRMRADMKLLLELKRVEDPKATILHPWDVYYYTERYRQKLKISEAYSSAREYLQPESVVFGAINIFAELFKLNIIEERQAITWHPTVRRYRVEQNDEPIGYFYLDMYARPDKYSGAAMFPLRLGITRGQLPEAALLFNLTSPEQGDGLMGHNEVVSFFHQLGHVLHHTFARSSRWATLTGPSLEWDFILAPAQVFEEWAWSGDVLRRFAQHHQTKEQIPLQLVERLRAARHVGVGIESMQQIFYQALSLALHSTPPKQLNLETITKSAEKRYSPFGVSEETHVYANFYQLADYSSLMYAQQWSLARARDILTRFRGQSLMNPRAAQAFVQHILSKGGLEPAHQLMETFLGRASNEEAYRVWVNTPPTATGH